MAGSQLVLPIETLCPVISVPGMAATCMRVECAFWAAGSSSCWIKEWLKSGVARATGKVVRIDGGEGQGAKPAH